MTVIIAADYSGKSSDSSAAVAFVTNTGESFSQHVPYSPHTAIGEIRAIEQAIRYAETLTVDNVIIVTDCKAAIHYIENTADHSDISAHAVVVQEILRSSKKKYSLKYQQGHLGNRLHNAAHREANRRRKEIPQMPLS